MDDVNALISAAQRHKGDWVSLAVEADVSYSWLTKFAQGHIPDPRVGTVRKLVAAINRREQVPPTPAP